MKLGIKDHNPVIARVCGEQVVELQEHVTLNLKLSHLNKNAGYFDIFSIFVPFQ